MTTTKTKTAAAAATAISRSNNDDDDTTIDTDTKSTPLPPISLRLELYKRIQVIVQEKIDFLCHELQDRRPIPLSFSISLQQQPLIPIQWTQPRKRQIEYYKTALLPAISAALLLPLPHSDDDDDDDDDKESLQENDGGDGERAGCDGTRTRSSTCTSLQELHSVLALVMGNLILVSHKNYDARCRHVLKTAAVEWMVELQQKQQQQQQKRQAETQSSAAAAAADKDKESGNDLTTGCLQEDVNIRDSCTDTIAVGRHDHDGHHHHDRHPRTIYFLTECTDEDKKDTGKQPKLQKQDEFKKPKEGEESKVDDDDDKNQQSLTTKDDNSSDNKDESEKDISQENNDEEEEEKEMPKRREESKSSPQPPHPQPQPPQTSSKSKKKTYKCTTTLFELDATDQAVRQFEAMERSIAVDILQVLVERNAQQQQQQSQDEATQQQLLLEAQKQRRNRRMDLLKKSLQITAAGVLVGGLFAVTGGLAAPGLVAAIAALGINSSAAAFAALTTTHALASMFGVLGGGLGVYKMSKRVQGLSEWRIRKETKTVVVAQEETTTSSSSYKSSSGGSSSSSAADTSTDSTTAATQENTDGDNNKNNDNNKGNKQEKNDKVNLHGLHAHVCVSGWLADKSDFQRPFGVQPNDPPSPPLDDLQRFFCVYAPERIGSAKDLLEERQDDLAAFGRELREKYGRDPGTLLPLQRTQEERILSPDTERTIYSMLDDHVLAEECAEKMKQIYEANTMLMEMEARNEELMMSLSVSPVKSSDGETSADDIASETLDESLSNEEYGASLSEEAANVDLHAKLEKEAGRPDLEGGDPRGQRTNDLSIKQPERTEESNEEQKQACLEVDDGVIDEDKDRKAPANGEQELEKKDEAAAAAHSQVIWDWQARYSGELYTVTWETDFLLNLCKVASVLFREIGDQISKQILTTALVGAAIAVPSALHTASSVIDDPYQIISLRSEKAGIELAHCLLLAEEHRPISLVGFSFGARVCFACLRELARHQLLWLEKQKLKEEAPSELPKKGIFARMRRNKNSKIAAEDDINYKREPASIVEDVVLIGMPRLISSREWINIREIVAGRIVNCYNPSDWIVSYMINIRCWNMVRKTCATHPIMKVSGIENYEVSSLAPSHGRYRLAVPQILHHVGYGQPKRPSQAASGK